MGVKKGMRSTPLFKTYRGVGFLWEVDSIP